MSLIVVVVTFFCGLMRLTRAGEEDFINTFDDDKIHDDEAMLLNYPVGTWMYWLISVWESVTGNADPGDVPKTYFNGPVRRKRGIPKNTLGKTNAHLFIIFFAVLTLVSSRRTTVLVYEDEYEEEDPNMKVYKYVLRKYNPMLPFLNIFAG